MLQCKQSSILSIVCICLIQIFLFSSCIFEDLSDCPQPKKMVNVQILPQWDAQDDLPDGVRVWFYSINTHKYVQDNFLPQGGETELRSGNYRLILYNNDSEKIMFRNIASYETAEAYTSTVLRPSYENPVSGEDTFVQPDKLWSDHIDGFEVSSKSSVIRFQPRQLVKVFTGKVEVEGLEKVLEVRGAVTGMLGSINLTTEDADRPSTICFDASTEHDDVLFSFRSFGVFYKGHGTTKHILSLEFLLPNGIIQRNVDISNQMENLLPGGFVEINNKLTIPPDTTGTGGGFNADVDDWKETIFHIDI